MDPSTRFRSHMAGVEKSQDVGHGKEQQFDRTPSGVGRRVLGDRKPEAEVVGCSRLVAADA